MSLISSWGRFIKALILIMFFIFGGFSQASDSSSFDVVFDLDWTLVYKTTPEQAAKDSSHIFYFKNEIYRLAPGTISSLRKLHETPGLRVSFNSGGSTERNEALLKFIYAQVNKDQEVQFTPYKVLSADDMVPNPLSRTGDSFAVRLKKSLLAINSNLKMILLIDDIKIFLMAGQEKNMLWTGTTHEDLLSYDDVVERKQDLPLEAQSYLPQNSDDYLNERYKIPRLVDLVLKAFQRSKTDPVDLIYTWTHDFEGKNLDLTKTPDAIRSGARFRCEHIFLL